MCLNKTKNKKKMKSVRWWWCRTVVRYAPSLARSTTSNPINLVGRSGKLICFADNGGNLGRNWNSVAARRRNAVVVDQEVRKRQCFILDTIFALVISALAPSELDFPGNVIWSEESIFDERAYIFIQIKFIDDVLAEQQEW